jgi:hypothetical protein
MSGDRGGGVKPEMVERKRWRFEGEEVEQGKVFYEVEYEFDESINAATRVEIHNIWYPIWPYGNNVRITLKITLEGDICFEFYRIRDSWDGTGRDNIAKICVDVPDLEEIFFLNPNELDKINSATDVRKYVKDIAFFINDIVSYAVERLLPELEK